MEYSGEINELSAALAKAQGAIKGAKKDTKNAFFKTDYADLDSVWKACREALSSNGLSVIQATETVTSEDGGKPSVKIVTRLLHASGQWAQSELILRLKDDTPQTIGSTTTYGRRYALSSMVGVAPEDDDGNTGSGRAEPESKQPLPQRSTPAVNHTPAAPTTDGRPKAAGSEVTPAATEEHAPVTGGAESRPETGQANPDEPPNEEERKEIGARLKKIKIDSKAKSDFILGYTHATDSKQVTRKQWDEVFTVLEEAVRQGPDATHLLLTGEVR